jgi:hypothetical protein
VASYSWLGDLGVGWIAVKLPKGDRVPPHTLSKAGLFTVISGTFRIGMGESGYKEDRTNG